MEEKLVNKQGTKCCYFLYYLCMFSSVLLNVCTLSVLVISKDRGSSASNYRLSWTEAAAEEAEAVAAQACGGHGRAYLDGSPILGSGGLEEPQCKCYSCYTGPDCSVLSPDCPADADSGNPLFLEPFWKQQAKSSAVMVAGWHRMGYRFDDDSVKSNELEKAIRQLHAVVGNANTTGRYILFGAGSTQLLIAALFGLSSATTRDMPMPIGVVASPPFYQLYKLQTETLNSVNLKWQGYASSWKNKSTNNAFIEFVTSPNNPDGQLKKRVLEGHPHAKTIFDHAYFWPHFTAIPAPANEDLMIFSFSKLTGHAGSRFGWAFVKDEALYQRMSAYLSLNCMSISSDTQLRALMLLKVVLQGKGKQLFGFGYKTMKTRWELLSQAIHKSKRFSLQTLEPHYCSFFKEVTGPSPAYAWLKCEREEEKDCFAVLRTAGIIGRRGSILSTDDRYVRLSLIKSQDDFDLLLQRIHQLVSQEQGVETI